MGIGSCNSANGTRFHALVKTMMHKRRFVRRQEALAIKREGDHPTTRRRFPEKLPARLMRLYTYAAVGQFPGEIVLDPFVGTGTTCAVAKTMGRQYVGIDINPAYIKLAQERIRDAPGHEPLLLVGRAKYPGKEELAEMAAADAVGTNGKNTGEEEAQTQDLRA